MRVLWLVNIAMPPVRAALGLPPLSYGGWLPAMLTALRSEARDIQVVCACRAWPAPDPLEHDGVIYLTLPRRPIEGRWRRFVDRWAEQVDDASLEAEMHHLIADVRPDLIHLHGTEQPHALSVVRAAGATPVLVSVQGPTSEYALRWTEGISLADMIADRASLEFFKGRGLAHSYRRVKLHGTREIEALKAASDVSGRTDWDRDVVSRANPRARYWHIDEVLRQPFYNAAWRGPAVAEPTIVTVTRAASIKGTDVLLRGFARIRDRYACRLRIVGQFEGTPLWPSLRRLEQSLGLTGRVDWVGECGAAEVADMLSACSVAVSPTRLDNSPNSVCEAMLVGAPVVASRTGGIPSLITHDQDGLLFPVGDDHALASSVLNVLENADLARRLGAQARLTAGARHDPSSVGRRMLDVYSMVASGGRE